MAKKKVKAKAKGPKRVSSLIYVYEGPTKRARWVKQVLRWAGFSPTYYHSPYVGHQYVVVRGDRREVARAMRDAGESEIATYINRRLCLAEFG